MKFRHLLAVLALFAAFDSQAAGGHDRGGADFLHIDYNALGAAEPASGLLMACGLGLLGLARRRRVA